MKITPDQFSEHLFWDVDKTKVDLERSKRLIIHRVLDYGLMEDWELLYQYYGLDRIAETAIDLRDLSDRSMVFISTLSKIPKEKFRCYITKQSIPRHWDL